VYRQHDEKFIDLLNSVRNNTITEKGLAVLRRDTIRNSSKLRRILRLLTTTNAAAETINAATLAKLDSPQLTFTGEIEGQFGKENLPTAIDLKIKPGAQIMMLTTMPKGAGSTAASVR